MADNYSLPKEIANGVYLLTSGAMLKASYVTKSLADRMLSKSAVSRGVEEGENIMFPAEGGKSSIPMYELSQKGYLQLNRQEVKKHFSRLVSFVPDYLRERGILPDKKSKTIEDRIQVDFTRYSKELKFESKEEIIARSRDTAIRQDIINHFSNSDLSLPGIGLLLTEENILESVYDKLDHKNYFEEKNSINSTVNNIVAELDNSSETVVKSLDPFQQELAGQKKTKHPDYVEFAVKTPSGERKMKMELSDFYKHLDTAMINRFAQHSMQDFPHRNYFGEGGHKVYDKIVQKRFCSNFLKNFHDYMPDQSNGYSLIIDCTTKQISKTDELSELRSRVMLKEYAENCYTMPQTALENIDSFISEHQHIAEEIQNAVASRPRQQDYINVQVAEYPKGNVYTFVNAKGEKAAYDERFDDEMRKNYNMPESIEECLVTLGAAEAAIENIKKSIVPEGSSIEKVLSDKDFQGSSEFEKLGITIQVDEFERGNVYVFKTPDGASVSFDERFDTEMLEYYGMPKSVDECLKNIGLSDEEVEICKQQHVFSEKAKPIEEIQKEAETKEETSADKSPILEESTADKKQAVVTKAETDLPFPEADIEASKVKTPAIDPQEQIFRNIASQINKVKR